jgi:hypothetical protein
VRNFPNELEDENGNVVVIGSKRVKREEESCWLEYDRRNTQRRKRI